MGPALTIDLAFDDAQQAIESGIAQFCRDQCSDEVARAWVGKFPSDLWRQLAELGVLALATPEGDGGAMEMVAACEALGRAVFPGPLSHTFFATQLLDESSRAAVVAGDSIVSVGEPPLMPWANHASVFIELDADRAHLARPAGAIESVETLGGEPWGRVALTRERELSGVERGSALYEISAAAYVTAAARQLVAATAEHARTRKQFGRAIGEFQAVAHPLADCEISLAASESLARAAAFRFDAGSDPAPSQRVRAAAGAARLSAMRASLETANVCHQLFGALGITLEGPVYHVTRRIRQLASQAPREGPARDAVLYAFGL